MRCPAAVKALLMAMEIEVSFAVGMRVKWRRWRVESTRAMLKSGVGREVREEDEEDDGVGGGGGGGGGEVFTYS